MTKIALIILLIKFIDCVCISAAYYRITLTYILLSLEIVHRVYCIQMCVNYLYSLQGTCRKLNQGSWVLKAVDYLLLGKQYMTLNMSDATRQRKFWLVLKFCGSLKWRRYASGICSVHRRNCTAEFWSFSLWAALLKVTTEGSIFRSAITASNRKHTREL